MTRTMTVLVTGGAGFIGSNFIRLLRRERPGWRVVNLDRLTYAGNLENLAGVEEGPGYRFVRGDVAGREAVERLFAEEGFDAVVHFAAESHVDRSILDPSPFLDTNVKGTQVLLEAARSAWPGPGAGRRVFLQVSTDEVYGSLGPDDPPFTEASPLAPNSPYAASKAAADLLCRAYRETYGLPVVITRCGNNFGPYQFPEKLIPLFVTNALEGRPLPLYGDGRNVRDWIHVEDHCAAILRVLEAGRPGEVYNVGAGNERTNLEITRAILGLLGRPESLVRFVADRPGHDRRYALSARKLRAELDWAPRYTFEEGLAATVRWYAENRPWWERVRSGAYRQYYETLYGSRLS